MEVKYSCPGRSRRDFLAMGEQSPIRNLRCGWFSFPGKEEELTMGFAGQGIHIVPYAVPGSPKRGRFILCFFQCAFLEQVGLFWPFWGGGSTLDCCQDCRV